MGYDARRFLQPPGDSLSCPVCKNVLCDPVTICSDGDVICSSCSPSSKSCPVDTCSAPANPPSSREANITLRTKVSRLLIRCTGASLGCSWNGPLRDELAHMKECTFQSAPCPHEACKEIVPLSSLEAHLAECPMRFTPCPNAPGCTFKGPLAKHESHRLTCNRYRCRQQPQGCRFIGTLAALREHRGFCNAIWDELTNLRAQANVTQKVPRDAPVNATATTPHAPASLPGREATLPPTPTSSLAEHLRGGNNSDSSSTPAFETSPDVTTSKVVPKQRLGGMPAVASREEDVSTSSRPVGEQLGVQLCVINDPASAPSRSSSVSLESLLAVHAGSPQGQHQVEDVGAEELQLRVSPWVDSPSPITQRPAEKRKSSQLKEGGHEKRTTAGSNGPPKKRQRVEVEQVMDNGLPEDQAKAPAGSTPAGSTPAGTDRPAGHPLSHPNMKRPYNGNHRGARGRGGFGHRAQDRKYPNGYGPHRHPAPEPQFYSQNPLVYPGPPQNPHPHPPVNPPIFYNPPYQQGYGHLPQARHLYNQNFSAPSPPANQNQNSGTPWQGFEWEALNGPYHLFSRERYSQPFPQVDALPYPHIPFPVDTGRDLSRFELPTRRPDLDNLYEDDVHLDYMDFDPGQSNPNPGGLPHHNKNIGTQLQAVRPQVKHTTPKDTSSAESHPSLNRLSASAGAALSTSLKPQPGQQPIDRVMVLQQRPDAPRLSNVDPSTAPNNNSLYNRQLDFTPSLLSQPPAEYVLDATFRKIEARDAARRMNVIQARQTAADDSRASPVLLVTTKQRPGTIREKGYEENNGSQKKTLRPPQAGIHKSSQPTTAEKRSTVTGSCTTVKSSPDASCSGRNLTNGPHSHEPSTRTGGATSGDDLIQDSVRVADGLRVMGAEVYESEKWGGGRLIPSGLKVARPKDDTVDPNATKLSRHRVSDKSSVQAVDVPENLAANRLRPAETHNLGQPCTSGPAATLPIPQTRTNVPPAATKSPANSSALRSGRGQGAKGEWKGYVLAGGSPPTSKGKLILLDAPPTLLPQRSTRSGKVFKPPGGGSSSEQSGRDDSEEEKRINRRRRSRVVARKYVLSSEHSDESSSPDAPLVNLKAPELPTAIHPKLGPPADRLQPVLTSLDSLKTLRPRHAAKRPPQFSSSQSLCSPSPSPQAKARHGRPPLRGREGVQPVGKGRGRGNGRGSKGVVGPRAGYMDAEGSATTPDDDGELPKQPTRENSSSTDNGPCRASPISCVRETSTVHGPTLSSPEPVIHVTSPQDSVIPDPTTLVSQLNLTNGHPQPQLPSSVVPSLGIDPLSTAFESHPYLNGLEDPGSGIRFLGEIEQVIDGRFLESLTHGLYGSSTSSCLDSDLMSM